MTVCTSCQRAPAVAACDECGSQVCRDCLRLGLRRSRQWRRHCASLGLCHVCHAPIDVPDPQAYDSTWSPEGGWSNG